MLSTRTLVLGVAKAIFHPSWVKCSKRSKTPSLTVATVSDAKYLKIGDYLTLLAWIIADAWVKDRSKVYLYVLSFINGKLQGLTKTGEKKKAQIRPMYCSTRSRKLLPPFCLQLTNCSHSYRIIQVKSWSQSIAMNVRAIRFCSQLLPPLPILTPKIIRKKFDL